MNRFRLSLPIIIALLLVVPLSAATTQPTSRPSTEFIRFTESPDGSAVLETPIVTYQNADGVRVDLIAALHVADASYYKQLQDKFKNYDSLLFEMVLPRGAPVPAPGQAGREGVSISGLQRFLQQNLELAYQLDAIDYRQKNFHHADLDWETFIELSNARGESIFRILVRAILNDMMRQRDPQSPPPTVFDLLAAMNAPDSARQLKLLLARQMQDIERTTAGLNGPNGSVILTERNKVAIAALDKALDRNDKSIGIFYGAAHMPDLEQRLLTKGFHPTQTQWLQAWDMRPNGKTP